MQRRFLEFAVALVLTGGIAQAASAFSVAEFRLQLVDASDRSVVFDFAGGGSFDQVGELTPGTSYQFGFLASTRTNSFREVNDAWASGSFDFALGSPTTLQGGANGAISRSIDGLVLVFNQQDAFGQGQADLDSSSQSATLSDGDESASALASSRLDSVIDFATGGGFSLAGNFSARAQSASSGGHGSASAGQASASFAFLVSEPTTFTVRADAVVGAWSQVITLPPAPPPGGPGSSQGLPLLPIGRDGSSFVFGAVGANGDWINPPIASGFSFEMSDGGLFTEIGSLPVGIDADDAFVVSVAGTVLGTFHGGDGVDFVELLGNGVSSFEVSGIHPGVDAENPLAFPIQLASNSDTARFRMTPIPEPTTALLLGLGVVGLLRHRRD